MVSNYALILGMYPSSTDNVIPDIIGDALTGLTVLRNTFSTIFVFAMPAWAAAVGIPNVFNTIGAIGCLVLSFAAYFIWKGKQLRVRTAKVYRYYAMRQFEARPI